MAGPGYGMAPMNYGQMRSSQADRERAIDVLKAAFAEGRLDQDEYTERAGLVYASHTYAELAALTADLPVGPLGALMPVPATQLTPMTPMTSPAMQIRRTDSLAIAAAILGLAIFVTAYLTALPALLLGVTALRRIRRTGERGRGLAIAAVYLGALGMFSLVSMHTF